MADAVISTLMISAAIIIIGFIANALFKRTNLPDMLILIFIGFLAGPIFGVFDPTSIQSFAPYIAALAVVYILFDGGMGLSLRQVILHSPRAVILAMLSFIFSMLITMIVTVVAFGLTIPYGLLFGSILGGSSSIVVISITCKIKISDRSSTTLILESALTDIFCIVTSLVIIGIIATGQTNYFAVVLDISGKFLIGIAMGLFVAIIWLLMMRRLNSLPFCYILTLSIALLTYAVSESLGGSGALSSLLFGLILGNERQILHFFKLESNGETSIDAGLRRFESEIAFLIRTFFFVFLGIIFTLSSIYILLIGILLSVGLLAVRYLAVRISTYKTEMKTERKLLTSILTRGLAAAVLSTLPAQYGLEHAELFVNIAVVIIVATAIIATIGVFAVSRRK